MNLVICLGVGFAGGALLWLGMRLAKAIDHGFDDFGAALERELR